MRSLGSGGLFTYSKFAHGATDLIGVSLPTRVGMVLLYAPAGLLAALNAWRAASVMAAHEQAGTSRGDHYAEAGALWLPAVLTALHFAKVSDLRG